MKIFPLATLAGQVAFCFFTASSLAAADSEPRHNVIFFVADGLRAGSVTPEGAPTMWSLAQRGVWFANSHSLFPTVTTANASAIATGHALADTGDYGNTLYVAYPVPVGDHKNSPTPFLENNRILADVYAHFADKNHYLGPESLLVCARAHHYLTAAVGKGGPVLIQDITQAKDDPQTIVIDDYTGTDRGFVLNNGMKALLDNAGIVVQERGTNGFRGDYQTHGTLKANVNQQQYFVDTVTKVILPMFKASHKPFIILYWSRDPDGTQHNQGDSLNQLQPGIDGDTSLAGVRNADSNLNQITNALHNLGLDNTTDIFITADHGFDTVSRHEINANGAATTSYAATNAIYRNSKGDQEVVQNYLPPGFLAIDLAHELGMSLYDPDDIKNGSYNQIDYQHGRRPSTGNGLICETGKVPALGGSDANVIVTANGGADFIYLPGGNRTDNAMVSKIVNFLLRQDYVSGIFVDDKYCHHGKYPGALPLSSINLKNRRHELTGVPHPAIVVNFTSFTTDFRKPLQHGVLVADTDLQEGQGNHGGFDRAATFNFMAACGPDFRSAHWDDPYPVSNADIATTFKYILFKKEDTTGLAGRIIREAMRNPPARLPEFKGPTWEYSETNNNIYTELRVQEFDGHRYFDAAGFEGRTLGLEH
jgi:hypothetical protein